MNKRRIILIIIAAVVLIGGSIAAGIVGTNSATPKTTQSIQDAFDEAYADADYFEEVTIQTYAGTDPEPQTDDTAEADSAGIDVVLNSLSEAEFNDFIERLPALDITAYFQLGVAEEGNEKTLFGFSYKDLQSEKKTQTIADTLAAAESNPTSYFELANGDVTGENSSKLTVTVTVAEATVEANRALVDAFTSESVDVLTINLPQSGASYVQTAAVHDELESFDAAVGFGLKFAAVTFTEANEISVITVGNEVQISYGTLDEGFTLETLRATATEINEANEYNLTVTVNDPAEAETAEAPAE